MCAAHALLCDSRRMDRERGLCDADHLVGVEGETRPSSSFLGATEVNLPLAKNVPSTPTPQPGRKDRARVDLGIHDKAKQHTVRTSGDLLPVKATLLCRRVESRWLVASLTVLVTLCLLLAAFVWWRLLSSLP